MGSVGRPPTAIGTYGKVSVAQMPPTKDGHARYKARARFRDQSGQTRPVARFADTAGRAERKLKEALAELRSEAVSHEITGQTTVAVLAGLWLDQDHDWSTRTRETYEYAIANHVKPRLGHVRVAELRPALVNRALVGITQSAKGGPGAAKAARTCLSGMCKLAIVNDVLTSNPTRDTLPISRASRKEPPKSLTLEQTHDLLDRLRCDRRSVDLDLPDLVEFMLRTGARIGETCAATEASVDVAARTWEINSTVVRVKGQGLVIQPRPKTAAGWRVLALPQSAVDIVTRRRDELRLSHAQGVIFGAPFARTLRDPSNTAKDLRATLDRLGFPEVHSHMFRKTVATRLDEAGLSSRQVADQLGHAKPSITQDVYMGRKVVSPDAARILDR